MPSRTITVDLTVDTRKILAALRSITRATRQLERNHATRPVSAERRWIQAHGRTELDAAIAWFQATCVQDGDR